MKIVIKVKHWLETVSSYLGLRLWLYEWKSNLHKKRVVRGSVVRLRIIDGMPRDWFSIVPHRFFFFFNFPLNFLFLKIERWLKRLTLLWQFNDQKFHINFKKRLQWSDTNSKYTSVYGSRTNSHWVYGNLASVFPIAFGYKLKVGLSHHILLLSCLNQRKHSNIANTCFAREAYSLFINSTISLETFQFGWFHESAWIHYQQK